MAKDGEATSSRGSHPRKRANPMSKLTISNVTAALKKTRGNLTYAADLLDCDRRALYNFLKKNPELEEVRDTARETLLDVAENHVADAVEGGDGKMIRWFLERMGKDRGYTTRTEQTGAGGGPLEFETITRKVVDVEKEQGGTK